MVRSTLLLQIFTPLDALSPGRTTNVGTIESPTRNHLSVSHTTKTIILKRSSDLSSISVAFGQQQGILEFTKVAPQTSLKYTSTTSAAQADPIYHGAMTAAAILQGISLPVRTSVLCLTVIACLWCLSKATRLNKQSSNPSGQSPIGSQRRTQGVRLSLVHNSDPEAKADVDIIAIHGLDTISPDTWTWKDPADPENKSKWVNWLQDAEMLPSKVDCVRIFTCDWPADLFERSDLRQKTIEEFARHLLDGIKGRPTPHRPILFIASCLGGIVLIQALVMADKDYLPVRESTRGIIFLATPFRGTSFQDVATWAELGLQASGLMRCRRVSKLLERVKKPTVQLNELVCDFTELCLNATHPYQIFTYYELGNTNLLRKVFPCLPDSLGKPVCYQVHL